MRRQTEVEAGPYGWDYEPSQTASKSGGARVTRVYVDPDEFPSLGRKGFTIKLSFCLYLA